MKSLSELHRTNVMRLESFALHSRHIFVTRVNKINFHFFRLHGATFCNVHSEFGYELVLGTSWLGYELAWYDLVGVRVDWKPLQQVWIRRRRSDVEKQLAYAVINTASKEYRNVRRGKETRNSNILQ